MGLRLQGEIHGPKFAWCSAVHCAVWMPHEVMNSRLALEFALWLLPSVFVAVQAFRPFEGRPSVFSKGSPIVSASRQAISKVVVQAGACATLDSCGFQLARSVQAWHAFFCIVPDSCDVPHVVPSTIHTVTTCLPRSPTSRAARLFKKMVAKDIIHYSSDEYADPVCRLPL